MRAAVTYVAGMTDRFAFRHAVSELGWDPAKLPHGVDREPGRRPPARRRVGDRPAGSGGQRTVSSRR